MDRTPRPTARPAARTGGALLACAALAALAAGCRTDLPPLAAEPPIPGGTLLPQPPAGGYRLDRPYPLLPGDEITINVLDHVELNHSIIIPSTRTFELFSSELEGRAQVIDTRGKTVEDLARDIAEAYSHIYKEKRPYVQVRLANPVERRVYIRGAVKTALSEKSIVSLPPGRRMTLYQCLQASGVLDEDADLSRVQISRKDPATGAEASMPVYYDLKEMEATQSYDRDPPLEPGDIISVPSFGKVSIFGNVNDPGTFRCVKGMTLTDLVIAAKGLKPFSKKSDVRVIRTLGRGIEQTFTVDLGAVLDGALYDPRLAPGDRVWVDEDWK